MLEFDELGNSMLQVIEGISLCGERGIGISAIFWITIFGCKRENVNPPEHAKGEDFDSR